MADAHDQDLTARTGSNLYPATMRQQFGELSLELDVPEGVWNPTPHGIHLGNMLMKLDFSNEHVLEIGTGCGIHAILLAKRGAREITITELHAETNANAVHNLRKHGVEIPIHQQVADWIHIEGASHQGGPWDTLVTNPHGQGRQALPPVLPRHADSGRPQTGEAWRPVDLHQLIDD